MTLPDGTVALFAVATATPRPAFVMASVAAACVRPVTAGTVTDVVPPAPGALMVVSLNRIRSMFRSVSVPSLRMPKLPTPARWTTVTVPLPFWMTS